MGKNNQAQKEKRKSNCILKHSRSQGKNPLLLWILDLLCSRLISGLLSFPASVSQSHLSLFGMLFHFPKSDGSYFFVD